MIPFGRSSRKKLQDLFVDAKIPATERELIPVLGCGERVIWVPGVKRAEFGRVTPGCKAVRIRCVWAGDPVDSQV